MIILERRSLKKSQIINKLIVHTVMKVVSIKLSRVAYDMSKYLGGILASPGVDPFRRRCTSYRYCYHPSAPLHEVLEKSIMN